MGLLGPERNVPGTLLVGDYPGLLSLAWQTRPDTPITEREALRIYEREWRHLHMEALTDRELAFIQHLADTYRDGTLARRNPPWGQSRNA